MSVHKNDASEVARLLDQIQAEYTAAERGLQGLAMKGSHEFLNDRCMVIAGLHDHLRGLVGDDAMGLIVKHLDSVETRTNP